MSRVDVAVLSYHGWEIDPDRLAEDVRTLRARGWRELSLEGVKKALTRRGASSGRYFHVTIDDGAEGDRECVSALGRLSCPVTLFLSLETMSAAAQSLHREFASCSDVALEDHSLRHDRSFHYRHVIGFHSDEQPLMTSPDRLGLQAGDPVCTYGGELVRRRFVPNSGASEVCQLAARSISARPSSREWTAALTMRLVESGLGSFRLGRLCVAGTYESKQAFSERLSTYLRDGRDRLAALTGRPPTAFAHPWWEPSPIADDCLRKLGYDVTFAGRGLCRRRGTLEIPRLFVSNTTPRPIDPETLAAADLRSPVVRWIRDAGRRTVFA